MTIGITAYIHGEITPAALFKRVIETLLAADQGMPRPSSEKHTFDEVITECEVKGEVPPWVRDNPHLSDAQREFFRSTHSVISSQMSQGLPARVKVTYDPDGPLMSEPGQEDPEGMRLPAHEMQVSLSTRPTAEYALLFAVVLTILDRDLPEGVTMSWSYDAVDSVRTDVSMESLNTLFHGAGGVKNLPSTLKRIGHLPADEIVR